MSARNTGYRQEMLRTCPRWEESTIEERLTVGALGIAGEAGEVADYVKKVLYHGTPLDKDKLIKELGDVRWYMEYLCAAIGTTIEEIEAKNTEKLRKRYPNGFSFEAANAPRKED